MAAALSAAAPGRHAVSCRWDSAYVSGTVMSHAKGLPLIIINCTANNHYPSYQRCRFDIYKKLCCRGRTARRACRVPGHAVEPVFQHLWCLATSWAVVVNCVVHQMFVCLKADIVIVVVLMCVRTYGQMGSADPPHGAMLTTYLFRYTSECTIS